MSTSTRNAARQLWPYQLPLEKPEKLAELLFRYENEPGRSIISGAQDAIGICVPGLARHYYNGVYWPERIERVDDEATLSWLEDHIYLVTLWPRPDGTDLLCNTDITPSKIGALTSAADRCWNAIMARDLPAFGSAVTDSFNAQTAMFPNMVNDKILSVIEQYKPNVLGWKLAGAGGGGYLALVADKPIANAMKIKIRRWME